MYSIDYDEYGNPIEGTYLGGGVGSVGGGGGAPSLGAGPTPPSGGGSFQPAPGGGNAPPAQQPTQAPPTGGPAPPQQGGGGSDWSYQVRESRPGYTPLQGFSPDYQAAPDLDRSQMTLEPGGRFYYDPNTGLAQDAADYMSRGDAVGNPVKRYLQQNAVWDVNDPFKSAQLKTDIPTELLQKGWEHARETNSRYTDPYETYVVAATNNTVLTPFGNYVPGQLQAQEDIRGAYDRAGWLFDYQTRQWRPATDREAAVMKQIGTWRGPSDYSYANAPQPTLINQ